MAAVQMDAISKEETAYFLNLVNIIPGVLSLLGYVKQNRMFEG